MLRLFVAFEVPEAQKDSVQKAIASLVPAAVPGARWTSRESWHVTVKFLGATA
jgi:2'-5' RNA ligase